MPTRCWRSSLLGDGVRVLIGTMKRIGEIAGETGAKLRDRGRSVKLRVLDIARAARSKAKRSREGLNRAYGKLLDATSRVSSAATHMPKASSSACSSPRRRSFVKERPASRTSSARW
jgi:transposase, IS5 family